MFSVRFQSFNCCTGFPGISYGIPAAGETPHPYFKQGALVFRHELRPKTSEYRYPFSTQNASLIPKQKKYRVAVLQ
jgi:hypothetical protein